jgi:hypothetical protein
LHSVGDTKGFRTVKKAELLNVICNFEITVKDTTYSYRVLMAGLRLFQGCKGLQFLFAHLLPDRDTHAFEVAMEFSEYLPSASDFDFTAKHSGQIVAGLGCRYNRANLFVTLYRFLETRFCTSIVRGSLSHEQQPLQEIEARPPPVRG